MNTLNNLNNPHTTGQPQLEEEVFDIRKIILILLENWKWFVLSIFVFATLGILYIKHQTPIYDTKASVIIEQSSNAPDEQFLMQGLGFNFNNKNNIDNEIGILTSPNLVGKVIQKLNHYITYNWNDNIINYNPELYKNSPIKVQFVGKDPEKITPVQFAIKSNGDGYTVKANYQLLGEEIEEEMQVDALPYTLVVVENTYTISKMDSAEFNGNELLVNISNPIKTAKDYITNLTIVTSTKMSTQLNISFKTPNGSKGKDFLAALVDEYNQDANDSKNANAANTAKFIEERLVGVSKELNEAEGNVERYRKEKRLTNIEVQSGTAIQKNQTYEAKLTELETQMNLLKFVDNFLIENKDQMIPNMSLYNQSLNALIAEYNLQLVKLHQIGSSASTINPVRTQLENTINKMRSNIITSVANEVKGVTIQIADIKKERKNIAEEEKNIPTLEREFADIARERDVKAALFTFLLQKREETNLTRAGVAPKAKIVASPLTGDGPIAPRGAVLLLVFLIIGTAIPAIVIYVLEFFKTSIEGMEDLDGLRGCTPIGDIMKADELDLPDSGAIVVKPDSDTVINEMFRTLRNNLLFMVGQKQHNTIFVTSTVPKEGKTFVAANIARSLSLMDKKVILVGTDLRNPQVTNTVGIKKQKRGVSSFLAGMDKNIDELLEEVFPNYYILQAGPIPPNPNELLSGKKTEELFSYLSEKFDYVIVDTAPIGVVSDTFTIAHLADATLYVVRENYSQKDTVEFINNAISEKRLHNVGVVLNYTDIDKGSKYGYKYGSKYGYGYKYRYRYKYSYRYGAPQKYGDNK